MKKLLFFITMMLSPMMASAQTVSDVQNSGCLNRTRSAASQMGPTIVLTKEGSVLSVQLENFESNCCVDDFHVSSNISGGSDGSPYSLSLSVFPDGEWDCECLCPFNVSFTVRDLEPNSFYLDCCWYKGQVELKEGEPLVLEYNNLDTPKYFPEGTKWTEIRLDTLKYDSWYSKVGDEWVANFEKIEYYVKGEYTAKNGDKFKCVYTSGPEWTDSLTLLIEEVGDWVTAGVLVNVYGEEPFIWTGEAYQFDWSVGKGLYFRDISSANLTSIVQFYQYYGIINEIKEGYFGGVRPLKYVDLDGKAPDDQGVRKNFDTNGGRIIHGIGITEWNDDKCLFGPTIPYSEVQYNYDYDSHYRSTLVHFERNGEVLYDVWPKKEETYRPFVEDDKVWKVGSTTGISDGIVKMVEYYYFDGDTIIDGKTCKQMMCQRFVSPEHPDYAAMSQIPDLRYVGAWYEEDKKVYVYNTINQLRMKYDFSLEANDTLLIDNHYRYLIGPKQAGGLEGFKGIYRDIMWYWDEDQNIYCTTWLEGVGGIDGPTINVYYGEEGHGLFLMSCAVGDEVIYLNDEYEDGATPEIMGAPRNRFDFTHTTKIRPKAPIKQVNSDASISSSEREVVQPKVKTPRRSEEELSLYGEYNDLQLGINLDPLDDAYLVCITNESGQVVYEKTVNAASIVALSIDISDYAKGCYTVSVENSLESFVGQFETQTTGIETITNSKEEIRTEIYNLQGQRLSSLQKGLNIVNGRKVYVK